MTEGTDLVPEDILHYILFMPPRTHPALFQETYRDETSPLHCSLEQPMENKTSLCLLGESGRRGVGCCDLEREIQDEYGSVVRVMKYYSQATSAWVREWGEMRDLAAVAKDAKYSNVLDEGIMNR